MKNQAKDFYMMILEIDVRKEMAKAFDEFINEPLNDDTYAYYSGYNDALNWVLEHIKD